jgi:hypothetical protein
MTSTRPKGLRATSAENRTARTAKSTSWMGKIPAIGPRSSVRVPIAVNPSGKPEGGAAPAAATAALP